MRGAITVMSVMTVNSKWIDYITAQGIFLTTSFGSPFVIGFVCLYYDHVSSVEFCMPERLLCKVFSCLEDERLSYFYRV